MGNSKTKQYLWLIELLRRNPSGLTLARINSEWRKSSCYLDNDQKDISRRTFLNHCHYIDENFGIRIKCTRSGANSFYTIETESYEPIAKSLHWQLSSISTEELLRESRDISDKILLEEPDSGSRHLGQIASALRNHIVLRIHYKSFHLNSKEQEVLVEPLCLKMFKRRWYMLAQRRFEKALRIYALDRVNDCEPTQEHYTYPENFSPSEFFSSYFGVSTDGYDRPCCVRLKAYQELPKYLISQPLHHSQRIEKQTAEYTIFSYWMIPAFDLVQEILLHADQLVVEAPESLQNILKEKINLMKHRYSQP